MNFLRVLLLGCISFVLLGCATQTTPSPATENGENEIVVSDAQVADDREFEDYDDENDANISDPLEPWNRFWFGFNDVLMLKVVKPVYTGYKAVTPQELRTGLSNAYHNIRMPIRLVNSILQGEFAKAWIEFGRFIVNSTLGFGGLIDVTKDKKPLVAVDPRDADFGQTLAKWGVGEGWYVVWPLVGPSTARDTAGLAGDYSASPFAWLVEPWGPVDFWPGVAADGTLIFNDMGSTLEAYESLTKSAIEPYTAMRDAYVKYRRAYALPKYTTPVPRQQIADDGSIINP